MKANEVLVEGQLTHVGPAYDLSDEGRALRILVVSKQVGGSLDHGRNRGLEHVTIAGRAEQVESAKHGARGPGGPRTDHMVGTENALKVLLGAEPGDPADLDASGAPWHVYDLMSLANSTLCSRAGRDSSGQGSPEMFVECSRHLAATIEILEPTIILAEGWDAPSLRGGRNWSVSRAVASVLGCPVPPVMSFVAVERTWGPVVLIAAYHPSHHWPSTGHSKWLALEPQLREARRVALGRA